MTKETKIGLLVGLAFIVVIGVLLSDHLTTRGELPQAQLTEVGKDVRMAANVPAGSTPPIAAVTVPTGVTPSGVVPTLADLNAKPATSIVRVNGPSQGTNQTDGQPAANTSEGSVTTSPTKGDDAQSLTGQKTGPIVALASNNAGDPIATDPLMQKASEATNLAGGTATVVTKQYKAEKGDTVSKMASKFMPGGNTSANRQLIVDANPVLKGNPAKVAAGHTYSIPVPAGKTPATTDLQVAGADAPVKAEKAVVSTTSYTVKANDTLSKIATSQLGDSSLVKEIKTLNKDVLKGKDVLHPGMTLKLPAKTVVASAR